MTTDVSTIFGEPQLSIPNLVIIISNSEHNRLNSWDLGLV